MTDYNAILTTDHRTPTRADLDDELIDRLAAFHPALGFTTGRLTITITYPAETLEQAATIAAALAGRSLAGLPVTATGLEVLPTAEFDRRNGMEPVPELLSVTEAAAELGVTPQAVRLRLDSGSLRGVKAGATWVVPRGEVERAKPRS